MGNSRSQDQESRPDLDEILLEYLERREADESGALDSVCAEHPELADQLRSVVAVLGEAGLAGDEPAPEAPVRLGDFEVRREVGRGGMGVVYEAWDRKLERRVAIKVLLAHLTHDDDTIERFRREGLTVSSLEHPSIVRIYGTGSEGGHDFLAMEFLEGAPLDRVIAEARRENPDGMSERATREAAELAMKIAEALQHAHGFDVIHRDVKPSNIFVRPDGSPVLTDFGLARRSDLPGLTRSGAYAGTPAYMAPEQASSSGAVDARSDVFSLGATLYEMITLRRPFAGNTTHELIQNIQSADPEDPIRCNPRIPADLAAIVQKALEKSPQRRYPDAGAFAADLRAFLEHRPVVARRATAIERTHRWIVRQPLKAALLAVMAIAIPVIAALSGFLVASQELAEIGERQSLRERVDDLIDRAALMTTDGDQSAAMLADAIALEPLNVEAVSSLAALWLINLDQPARAIEVLDEHPDLVQRERVLRRIRAWSDHALGHTEDARAELEKLGDPTDSLEAFFTGVSLMHRPDFGIVNKSDETALHYLLDAEMLAPRPRPAIYHYAACAAGHIRDEANARRFVRALHRHWPDSYYAWRATGLALYDIDPPESVAAYRKALDVHQDPTTRTNFGHALSRQGKSDEAMAEWRKVVEDDPDFAAAWALLGREAFSRREDPESAARYLAEAVRIDPTRSTAHYYRIWSLQRLKRIDEAFEAAHEAIAALPDHASLQGALANLHLDADQADRAVATLRDFIADYPDNAEGRLRLGNIYEELGREADAQAMFEDAVRIATPAARRESCERLAEFFLASGADGKPRNLDRALELAHRLVDDSEGKDPYVIEILADALLAGDRPREAHAQLQRALAIAEATEHANYRVLTRRVDRKIEKLTEQLAER